MLRIPVLTDLAMKRTGYRIVFFSPIVFSPKNYAREAEEKELKERLSKSSWKIVKDKSP